MGVIFYLIFLAVTSLIAVFWFLRVQKVLATSREQHSTGRQIAIIVAMVFLVVQFFVLLYLYLVTFDALSAEFNPGKPKPYFLVTYFLGLFVYGLCTFFRMPLSDAGSPQSSQQQKDEEDESS